MTVVAGGPTAALSYSPKFSAAEREALAERPSWGNMLSNAQSYFRLGPHLVFAPGTLYTYCSNSTLSLYYW